MLSVRGIFEKGEIKISEKLSLDIGKEIPVIVTFLEDTESAELPVVTSGKITYNRPQKYRFSDLAGNLEWKGDAVAQQRALRDEW
jgi:hypothetical protein